MMGCPGVYYSSDCISTKCGAGDTYDTPRRRYPCKASIIVSDAEGKKSLPRQ